MADLERFLVGRRDGGGGSEPVFARLVDLLAFAAVYGAAHGQWEELHGATGEPVPEHIFEESYAGLFYALHMLRDPGPHALADETADERVSIFEGYANAGMQMLASQISLIGTPADELERLLRACVPELNASKTERQDENEAVLRRAAEMFGEGEDSIS